jgi:hypothetical protein
VSAPERDPDLGPTRKTPSTQEQLDRSELVIRAEKIKHLRTQTKLVDEANSMTRHPKKADT